MYHLTSQLPITSIWLKILIFFSRVLHTPCWRFQIPVKALPLPTPDMKDLLWISFRWKQKLTNPLLFVLWLLGKKRHLKGQNSCGFNKDGDISLSSKCSVATLHAPTHTVFPDSGTFAFSLTQPFIHSLDTFGAKAEPCSLLLFSRDLCTSV